MDCAQTIRIAAILFLKCAPLLYVAIDFHHSLFNITKSDLNTYYRLK